MRVAMLIVHFLGLAMALGSSIGILFLRVAATKLKKEERLNLTLNSFALSRMGHIGLTFLIISGLYLMTPFWGSLSAMPMLMAKLLLVLVLTLCIIVMTVYSSRAKKGDTDANLKKIATLGKVALLTGVSIVLLAVLIFR